MRRFQVEYKSNNNVVYSCKYHVVFCPKYRRKVLIHGVGERLKTIIREIAIELQADILDLEVMPDHVHLLCEVDPQRRMGIPRRRNLVDSRTPVSSGKSQAEVTPPQRWGG